MRDDGTNYCLGDARDGQDGEQHGKEPNPRTPLFAKWFKFDPAKWWCKQGSIAGHCHSHENPMRESTQRGEEGTSFVRDVR